MKAMHDSVLRLLACARIVSRNIKKPITDTGKLAESLGVSSATMTNWKSRGVSKAGALKAETEIGCRPAFILEGQGDPFSSGMPPLPPGMTPFASLSYPDLYEALVEGVDHPVSFEPMQTVPLISWEQLMCEDPKGALEFRVVMPDESMSPRVRAGAMLYFRSGESPRPGDGVLVRDSTRAVHFREYRAGRPGLWEAHAVNPHYQPMESDRDGLTVLGVLTAVGARWG
ncbi:MAG: S24 family peptidase [Paucibacter sp.]|nr:S24 family peptidase [Roseateles sp.]